MTAAKLETGAVVAEGAPAKPAKRTFNIRARRAAEARFKAYGVAAICLAIGFLCLLLFSIISQGYKGFVQANVELSVPVDADALDPDGLRNESDPAAIRAYLMDGKNFLKFKRVLEAALYEKLGVDPQDRDAKKLVAPILSNAAAADLRQRLYDEPSLIGSTVDMWFLSDADVDSYLKGIITRETPEERRQLNDAQLELIDQLAADGVIETKFNTGLFTNTTSKRPEAAGLSVAIIGSLQMMVVVLIMTLPIGVAASIYLEEFAPKNRVTDLIEVNINNLAAVPSIVFGILGLSVFINFMGLPRSAALVGGMVLTLMTLPTIIIATRASLRAVPPSIRQAALGVGASKTQAVFHHVLPLAMPGILTGTIIGLAQALGETAPLLMIGMDASVFRVPEVWNPTDPSTSLPSQIYQWAREDDRTSFDPRTSAAIMVLLAFLAFMNLTAVLLRRRFERRW